MKYCFLILAFLLPLTAAGGIVNNAGSSPEDSVSLAVYCTDSIGNPIAADSFFVLTVGPSGDSVFAERITTTSPRLDSSVMSGFVLYRYRAAVADIDGAGAGSSGLYQLNVTAKHTSPEFFNTFALSFQIIPENPSAWGDSIGLAARTSHDALDSLAFVIDSLYAVLDSLQSGVNVARISDDAGAANALEAMLDGTGGVDLNLRHIAVNATDNDSAVVLRGSGSGVGLAVHSSGGSPFSQPTKLDLATTFWGFPFDFPFVNGSLGDSLTSPTYVQGEAASIDSAAIADWVWNTPQADHQAAGTFGSYLDANISGLGSGAGLFAVSLIVYDTVLQQVVPHASLAIRNSSQSALIAVGSTSLDGSASFSLDGGLFAVLGAAPGYIFDAAYGLSVSGVTVDTLPVSRFDPGQPPAAGLCRVYAYLTSPAGLPLAEAEISATLPDGAARSGDAIVSPGLVTTATDSTGFFSLDLIPSNHLQPDTTRYEISIALDGATILRKRLLVPDLATWRLSW